MTKKRKSSKIIGVITAVLLALLCVAVWLPTAFGLESYYVQTGSMEPAVPEGSMVYITPIDIEDINAGIDVLLFSNSAQTKAFMHRVMFVEHDTGLVYTKGDANETADLLPTSFALCRGKVIFSIPYWGYVAQALGSVWGKAVLVLFYIGWLAVEIEIFKSKRKR